MENDIQIEISKINRKLDLLLEEFSIQKSRRESIDDLLEDLNIIGKDAFNAAVVKFDKEVIDIDPECISRLFLKILKNTQTFNQMLDRLESVNDLIKDAEPVVRQMGLDIINKLGEFEKKGYFEYFNTIIKLGEKITKSYSVEDINSLNKNIDLIFSIIRNLTNAETLKNAEKITLALRTVKIDDNIDNKSLYRIYKELKTPEVRKTLSYTLRLVKEISNK